MTAERTRGQVAAAAVVRSFALGRTPHAIVLVGPAAIGKTTLAADLAATLLCAATDPAERPCGRCRACRMVASGNHPDLHILRPDGPGGQIGIGQVRGLATELALLPVEGGARVAVLEAAHRLTEDAQHALLKTLEEPPSGVVIVLCADDEDRLLPTVRSRCARVRLGPLSTRAIEGLLEELGLSDPPTAARLARLAAGRPGLAIAYATAPEAVAARGEVTRRLLDLLDAGPAARLRAARELLALADDASSALGRAAQPTDHVAGPRTGHGMGRRPGRSETTDDGTSGDSGPTRASAADRRRTAAWLLEAWADVARDLAIASAAGDSLVRDAVLLEELGSASRRLPVGATTAFLGRLGRAVAALEVNASPELVVDVLVLAWPRAQAA